MNIAICDRYDTDVARINELLDANIKRHMLNHALLEVDTFTSTDELLASPERIFPHFFGNFNAGDRWYRGCQTIKRWSKPSNNYLHDQKH